ncbi:MAG: carbamoyl-phosphate synthase large subunit [Actinomycetes bacterium]
MPRRDDIKRIMLLGSGPIVIGQAAEFDYSGTQACKVLREEGYEIVLVNSNPATIMTDPDFADATYIEPLLPETVARIIEKERPDAILPTLGGQTALNLAKSLHEDGTLERYGVELIGADYDAIHRAEDRDMFRQTMLKAGLRVPRSAIATNMTEAREAMVEIGLPIIIRPAFTLGGRGGGAAYTQEEFERIVKGGLDASPISQVLIDESVIGWGEFEMEVMRDHADNVVIVCSIENLDPMGVHTGDSVCVAPQQTLTDPLYQKLRDQSIAVIRAVGVETGGSNVQFAVNPETEEIVVIEMNPRVSRSSALASKATGFPIAKIAARLAVGYTLEEIPNDITLKTPASFEPVLDYVVVKWPRFAFEKFVGADTELTTHMKSVGEAMALGADFKQAFSKALRSRELDSIPVFPEDEGELMLLVTTPGPERFDAILEALRRGVPAQRIAEETEIEMWFITELAEVAKDISPESEGLVRTFRAVDTCAAEFEAETPYFYSSWEQPKADGTPAHEAIGTDREAVVILGSGPNRIGQGIEFDYCCVHAAQAVKDADIDAVMVNCNPETVSTDYDTSTRLYFEPLTLEDVAAICEHEKARGVIVQFGGQTPLRLAAGLEARGIKILGTSIDSIDLAEDRGRFGPLLDRLGYQAPAYATATSPEGALKVAGTVGYPLLVRPSYVLGGRAMEIVYDDAALASYLDRTGVSVHGGGKEIFLDRFLEDAVEIDVDALCDGENVWIAGIMQHVEEAGIHSGDSACVLPPHSLSGAMLDLVREQTTGLAQELGVIGLLNVQFAVFKGELYVIEANPRASRTVPFVSKAIGLPLAQLACRLMLGETIAQLDLPDEPLGDYVCVKEAVLPFDRFAGADALLGPEMRSTGEVMGIAKDFPTAFAKAQSAAGAHLPQGGAVFLSVSEGDKVLAGALASQLHDLGFRVIATRGTAEAVSRMGIPAHPINKIPEGSPHVVDLIEAGEVGLVVNTPTGSGARADGWEIRAAAIGRGIPCITTMAGGLAAARAIAAARGSAPDVIALQDMHREVRA